MLNKLFNKTKRIPSTYQEKLQPQEVIELYTRLTLHQQAAMIRLMARNLVVKTDNEDLYGYELDFDVVGAMIEAKPSESDDVVET